MNVNTIEIQFEPNSISDICNKLRQKNFALTQVHFNYSNTTSEKKTLLIDTYGFYNMLPPDNETFYENVEEHITYTYFRWLGPLIFHFSKNLKINLNSTVNVLNTGEFSHSDIKVQISISIFNQTINNNSELSLAKEFFEKILPFYQYITKVELKGHQFKLSQILFHLNLDGEKVYRLMQKTNINKKILSQWLATLDNFIDQCQTEYKSHTILDIIDGIMNTAKYKSSNSFYFTHKSSDKSLVWHKN